MTSPRARRPLLRAAGFGAVAAGLTVAACQAPGPAHPSRSAPFAPAEFTTREALDLMYPQLARGVGDSATVLLVYSPEGRLVDHRLTVQGQARTRPQGLPAWGGIPSRLETAYFAPGVIGPDPVRVFTLHQLTREAAAASVRGATETIVTTAATSARKEGKR